MKQQKKYGRVRAISDRTDWGVVGAGFAERASGRAAGVLSSLQTGDGTFSAGASAGSLKMLSAAYESCACRRGAQSREALLTALDRAFMGSCQVPRESAPWASAALSEVRRGGAAAGVVRDTSVLPNWGGPGSATKKARLFSLARAFVERRTAEYTFCASGIPSCFKAPSFPPCRPSPSPQTIASRLALGHQPFWGRRRLSG
jgi:hypothetical protein